MARRRPNILLFVMDDQRHDAVSALGGPDGDPIARDMPMLPRLLAEAGYQTRFTGKWHNDGTPQSHGFEVARHVFNGGMLYPEQGGHYNLQASGSDQRDKHNTELFCQTAAEMLTEGDGRPWFQTVALMSPHDPFDAPPPWSTMYDPTRLPLPPNFLFEHPFDNGDMTIRDELLLPWPLTHEAVRRYRADYYAMVSHPDHHVGRVLDALAATGQADDTLVVFTGDHGLAVGSHGLLGKENLYDHGVRVPLLMRGPGVPRGHRSSALVHHPDLLPTLCASAGVEVPADAVDGWSLLPLLAGERSDAEHRDALLGAFVSPTGPGQSMRDTQRSIRTERWKLCFYPHLPRYQLFDLAADPHERCDLLVPWRLRSEAKWGFAPATPESDVLATAEELRRRLVELQRRSGDVDGASNVEAVGVAEAVAVAGGRGWQNAEAQ